MIAELIVEKEEKAIPYAERWMQLDPEDESAPLVIKECEKEIKKRKNSKKRKL